MAIKDDSIFQFIKWNVSTPMEKIIHVNVLNTFTWGIFYIDVVAVAEMLMIH